MDLKIIMLSKETRPKSETKHENTVHNVLFDLYKILENMN